MRKIYKKDPRDTGIQKFISGRYFDNEFRFKHFRYTSWSNRFYRNRPKTIVGIRLKALISGYNPRCLILKISGKIR